LADDIASLLAVPDEIERVSVSLATGNALIRFDPSRATEQDLLDYLQQMFEVSIGHRDRFERLPPERLPEVFERLEESVRAAVRPRLKLNTGALLRDDVLA
jgi:hypothetical protein